MPNQHFFPVKRLNSRQDVYVVIRILDKDSKALWHQNIPMKDLPPGTTAADIPNENVW
jgi:hypothetical protein